jgi:two-component system LytT family sensor kinase
MRDPIILRFKNYFTLHKYFFWFLFGTWTLLALFMSSQLYTRFHAGNIAADWSHILIVEFTYSYLFFLLSPLMLVLADKLPFNKRKWLMSLFSHIVLSTVITFIILGIRRYLLWLSFEKTNISFDLNNFLYSIYLYLDYGIMSYLLVAFFSYTYKYYNQFKERELKTAKLEKDLIQAQLQALKMQLQPHFLFNTLNSISALIRKNENEKATGMIAGLGNFLRLTLENQDYQEVELKKEIELLKLYLDIQQIRFSDKIEIYFDIDPSLLSVKVPYLILQPIVENAINHGLLKKADTGHLKIISKKNNNKLQIIITDDGAGMEDNIEYPEQKGIGLLNTESRLEKLYGKSYSFQIKNNDGNGVTVFIEIPLINHNT